MSDVPLPVPTISATFSAEVATVRDALMDAIGDLARGVASSLKAYATAIATDIVRARSAGEVAKIDELTAQALALAAVNKVRLAKSANAVLNAFIRGAMTVASAALGGVR